MKKKVIGLWKTCLWQIVKIKATVWDGERTEKFDRHSAPDVPYAIFTWVSNWLVDNNIVSIA